MIDQFNDDGTGWAQFGDELRADGESVMRYHLARLVSDRARGIGGEIVWQSLLAGHVPMPLEIATFLLINPSTANAFKPDPTVGECVKFTRRWGHDITWVVNAHAFRSPYPIDLKKRACGMRGDDAVNDEAIMLACSLATVVVVGWGNDGALDHRDQKVLAMLQSAGIKPRCLGFTQSGSPKHPLARGKHRIPADQQPISMEF